MQNLYMVRVAKMCSDLKLFDKEPHLFTRVFEFFF